MTHSPSSFDEMLTADGTVLSANPAASRILGVDAAQLLQKYTCFPYTSEYLQRI